MNGRWSSLLAVGLVSVLLLLGGTNAAWGHPLPPRAMVVVDAQDFQQLRDARKAIEAAGGVVQGMTPPSMLLVRLDPQADVFLVGQAGITAIERGSVDAEPAGKTARRGGRSRADRIARRAWNQRLRAKSPAAQRKPLPPELLGVDMLEVPAGAPGDDDPPAGGPESRSSTTNSRYMAGDCVVTVVLTESDGSQEASTENWTEDEEAQVTAEIQEGLSWLADMANTTYNANLTFIYEWHYGEPTRYEPITTIASFPRGNAAVFEFLQRHGYYGSLGGGRTFNSAQRVAYGADMAYMLFVADSSNDSDGYFTDGYIAYAYLGGPWSVENYRNDGWGISRMNLVTAHETGHIFGAGDEYAASGRTASDRYGYLSVLNGNAVNGGVGASCLMNNNALSICKWSAGQLGLHLPDTTNDGTPDCFQYDAGGTVRRDQLAYVSHALDDDVFGDSEGNGDGQADAGETIELSATIQNDAYVRMRAVTGTLTTSSPYVAIVDSTASFGDVDYTGSQASTSDRFVFAVSPAAPDGTATLTLELETAQGWHFSFTVDVAIEGGSGDVEAPAVPTGLSVTGTGDRWAALAWNDNTEPDLDHYNLYRSENAGFGYALVAQPAGTTYTDNSVANGRTYYYKLSASDAVGNESATSAEVAAALADEPPNVTILSPENGLTVDHDEELDFSATASDREDGSLSGQITWTSDLQGGIGFGASFSRTLQPGTHLITASVTDSGGNTAIATLSVTVREPDSLPAVTITAPAEGAEFTTEDTVPFTAAASDAEDGDLTPLIEWTSNLDGPLGFGGNVSVMLSEGTHTITARVTDSADQTQTDRITVSVTVAPLKPPVDLRVSPGRGATKLRWRDTNTDETGYRVERAEASETPAYRLVGSLGPEATDFKDVALSSGEYLYRVRAVRGGEQGPASTAARVRIGKKERANQAKELHVGLELTEGDDVVAPHVEAPEALTTDTPAAEPDQAANPSAPGANPNDLERTSVVGRATVTLTIGSLSAFPEIREHFRKMYEEMRRSLRDGG